MSARITAGWLGETAAVLAACVVTGTAVGDDSGYKADEAKPPREIKSFGDAEKDLKRLAIAMHHYERANGRLPPAAVRDKNGKPTVSWRVLILPYIEQNELYKQFKLDESWDSNHNRKLVAKMPAIYRSPTKKLNDDGMSFDGFVLPDGWPGHMDLRVGRPAERGEVYTGFTNAYATGEPLHCSGIFGLSAADAASRLPHGKVTFEFQGYKTPTSVPVRVSRADVATSEVAEFRVSDAIALSLTRVLINVTPDGRPVSFPPAIPDGKACPS